MGVVLSAIATGLVHNIEKDSKDQQVKNKSKGKHVEAEDITDESNTEEREVVIRPGFQQSH